MSKKTKTRNIFTAVLGTIMVLAGALKTVDRVKARKARKALV